MLIPLFLVMEYSTSTIIKDIPTLRSNFSMK
jgi:hypothetical protein